MGGATFYTYKHGAAACCGRSAGGTLESVVRWGRSPDGVFLRRAGGSGGVEGGVELLLLLGRDRTLAEWGQRLDVSPWTDARHERRVKGQSGGGERAGGPESVREGETLKGHRGDPVSSS